MRHAVVAAILFLAVVPSAGPACADILFTEIPVEELHTDGLYCNMKLSADGEAAGLFWGWHVYRWTRSEGLTTLALNGDTGFSASIDISGDGTTILSTIADSMDITGPAIRRPGDTEWTFLGGIAGEPPLGSEWGTASAINHDGTAATGLGWAENEGGWLRATPFLWTESGGVAALPKADADHQARGNDISGDGSVVVGWNENDFGNWRPCRWIDGAGPDFFLGETTLGVPDAISPNGTYVATSVAGAAYRWSETDGLISLGFGDWPNSRGHGVSDDGTVVGYEGNTALIWTETEGLRQLHDALTDAGCTDHLGWELHWAIDISADGRGIIGAGRKPNGWAGIWHVRFPDPTAVDATSPTAARLTGAYPNPFNPHTTIAFTLDVAQAVSLRVYAADGRRVATLREGVLDRGAHDVVWNGCDDRGRPLASGAYLVRLEAGSRAESRKIQLIR